MYTKVNIGVVGLLSMIDEFLRLSENYYFDIKLSSNIRQALKQANLAATDKSTDRISSNVFLHPMDFNTPLELIQKVGIQRILSDEEMLGCASVSEELVESLSAILEENEDLISEITTELETMESEEFKDLFGSSEEVSEEVYFTNEDFKDNLSSNNILSFKSSISKVPNAREQIYNWFACTTIEIPSVEVEVINPSSDTFNSDMAVDASFSELSTPLVQDDLITESETSEEPTSSVEPDVSEVSEVSAEQEVSEVSNEPEVPEETSEEQEITSEGQEVSNEPKELKDSSEDKNETSDEASENEVSENTSEDKDETSESETSEDETLENEVSEETVDDEMSENETSDEETSEEAIKGEISTVPSEAETPKEVSAETSSEDETPSESSEEEITETPEELSEDETSNDSDETKEFVENDTPDESEELVEDNISETTEEFPVVLESQSQEVSADFDDSCDEFSESYTGENTVSESEESSEPIIKVVHSPFGDYTYPCQSVDDALRQILAECVIHYKPSHIVKTEAGYLTKKFNPWYMLTLPGTVRSARTPMRRGSAQSSILKKNFAIFSLNQNAGSSTFALNTAKLLKERAEAIDALNRNNPRYILKKPTVFIDFDLQTSYVSEVTDNTTNYAKHLYNMYMGKDFQCNSDNSLITDLPEISAYKIPLIPTVPLYNLVSEQKEIIKSTAWNDVVTELNSTFHSTVWDCGYISEDFYQKNFFMETYMKLALQVSCYALLDCSNPVARTHGIDNLDALFEYCENMMTGMFQIIVIPTKCPSEVSTVLRYELERQYKGYVHVYPSIPFFEDLNGFILHEGMQEYITQNIKEVW